MLDELLFSKLRCGLFVFFFVLLFLFYATGNGNRLVSSPPTPSTSCFFSPLHALQMRVLLTVANNNTLPFCALDAIAILHLRLLLLFPYAAFGPAFPFRLFVLFFAGELLLYSRPLFLNFLAAVFAALLISCWLFTRRLSCLPYQISVCMNIYVCLLSRLTVWSDMQIASFSLAI